MTQGNPTNLGSDAETSSLLLDSVLKNCTTHLFLAPCSGKEAQYHSLVFGPSGKGMSGLSDSFAATPVADDIKAGTNLTSLPE